MQSLRRVIVTAIMLAVAVCAATAQAGASGDRRNDPGPRSHELVVTSNVRGAEIYIDGVRQRETTPATFTLRPGNYTLRVEARGYDEWQARVLLTSNQTVRANLVRRTATVMLRIPSDLLNDRARDPWRMIDLYIDGRLRPETRIEVDPGYHDIEIVSGGLRFEREFYFEAGRVYTLELLLRLDAYQNGR